MEVKRTVRKDVRKRTRTGFQGQIGQLDEIHTIQGRFIVLEVEMTIQDAAHARGDLILKV